MPQHEHYNLPGTKNIDPEQHSGAYLDPKFWPNFRQDYKVYKERLLDAVNQGTFFSSIRISHTEFGLMSFMLNNRRPTVGFHGHIFAARHCKSKPWKPQPGYVWDALESISNATVSMSQIGHNFERWGTVSDTWPAIVEYRKHKKAGTLPYFIKNYKKDLVEWRKRKYRLSECVDLPMDFNYALVATKWLFKKFRNQIGLISNSGNLNKIKKLMQEEGFRKFIHSDKFLDYIPVKQEAAFCDDNFDELLSAIEKSPAKVFLLGVGGCKLRFYNKLRKTGNRVFIDIGFSMNLIAGDDKYRGRPYCGDWESYKR